MMKVYLFLATCLLAVSASAQTFQWDTPKTIDTNLQANTTELFPMYQSAIGTDTVTLGVEVIYNDIPQTWDGMLCIYGLCLGIIPDVGVTAEMDPVFGSNQGMVRLTVNPYEGTEVAKFQVYVYDVNFPNDGDTATWIFNTTLGVENITIENSVELYPNPVTNELHIRAPFGVQEAAVFSISGAEILKSGLSAGQETLQLETLPSGAYMLQILTEKGTIRKRFNKL